MIKHIVMWRLKEQAMGSGKRENAQRVREKLESMRGKIPGMVKIELGFDFSATPDSSDVVLYSEFESREALEGYMTHPVHEAVKDFIREVRTERHVVDYEVVRDESKVRIHYQVSTRRDV